MSVINQDYIQRKNWFFPLFVTSVLITSFPSTKLFYIVPFILLFLSFTRYSILDKGKFFLIMYFLTVYTSVSLLFESLRNTQINVAGVVFSIIMYLPILILISRKRKFFFTDKVNRKFIRFMILFVIVESLMAFLQAVFNDDWDTVSGSFGLFDFITGSVTISQVMFTFNIFIFSFYLITYVQNPYVKLALILSAVAVALAQSGHQTIFFLMVVVIMYLSKASIKSSLRLILTIGFFVGIITFIYSDFFYIAGSWSRLLLGGGLPKVMAIQEYLKVIDDWKILLFGTGLAQFSSRAALFSSGSYLQGAKLPDFIVGESSYFQEIIWPLVEYHEKVGAGSAISQPYFSVLSVLSEFGLILFILIVYFIIKELRRNRKIGRESSSTEVLYLTKFLNASIIFFLLCCFVENYAEFVQALTIPILLFIYVKGRINYLHSMEEKK